jgi:hypothetical protein
MPLNEESSYKQFRNPVSLQAKDAMQFVDLISERLCAFAILLSVATNEEEEQHFVYK